MSDFSICMSISIKIIVFWTTRCIMKRIQSLLTLLCSRTICYTHKQKPTIHMYSSTPGQTEETRNFLCMGYTKETFCLLLWCKDSKTDNKTAKQTSAKSCRDTGRRYHDIPPNPSPLLPLHVHPVELLLSLKLKSSNCTCHTTIVK